MQKYQAFVIIVFTFLSCNKDKVEPQPQPLTNYIVNNVVVSGLDISTIWQECPQVKEISPVIDEISGIIPAIYNNNSYWVHEDSGSDGKLFLYSNSGQLKGKLLFSGQSPKDMEDISLCVDKANSDTLIAVADIGDNDKKRSYIKIITFKEPLNMGDEEEAKGVRVIKMQYFNSENKQEKHDCEAFSIDPKTGNLYLFTKSLWFSYIFRLKPPFNFSDYNKLEKIGEFQILKEKVTASDISLSGNQFILKTYNYLLYWKRLETETFEDMLAKEPVKIPYFAEVQGEAVCFSKDECKYITISEKNNNIEPKLRIYSKK